MEYTQQLEDYATQLEQLEQQTKQWEQKVKDTAKPFSDFYNKASTLMKKGMDLYIQLIRQQDQNEMTTKVVSINI